MRTDPDDARPIVTVIRTRSGWLVQAAHVRFEVERGASGAWRVASPNGRERVDNSLVCAAASVCRIDKRTAWLLTLERQLGGAA